MSELWQYDGKKLLGKRHRKVGMICQDNIAYKESNTRQAIALIDGIGRTNLNAIMGELIVNLITEFLLDNYEMIQQSEDRTVAYNLMLRIDRLFDKIKKDFKVQRKELGSTLLGVAIDTMDNSYCSVHLGDGVIAIQTKMNQIYPLSEPINGEFLNETILSTTGTLKYVDIKRGNLEELKGFLLVSDGIYNNYQDIKKLDELFQNNPNSCILNEKEDDQSFIMLTKN